MGYYYHDDKDNKEKHQFSMPVVIMTAVVSGVILVILLMVLATNKTNTGKNNLKNNQMLTANSEENDNTFSSEEYYAEGSNQDYETKYKNGTLRAEDLDIWNMYSREGYESPADQSNDSTQIADDTSSDGAEATPTPTDEESPSPSPTPEEDALIEGVKENTVDYTNIQIVDNKMKYTKNGETISKLGVMISEQNGVVDFNMLKDNGVEFVMIKVGQRGYDSGVISKDGNFDRNIKAANDAELPIGLYFSSRAVNTAEAAEEAEFCVRESEEYIVKYPVAFVFDGEIIDDARTDELTNEDKTDIVLSFMKNIKMQGYSPILMGSKSYILDDLSADKLLKDFDVLLNCQDIVPDYPYQFKMWRYSINQTIPGIEKGGDYVISFADYAGR